MFNRNLDSINISSAQNRNMLVSFMLYVLYMVAIVSSATHIDLLFNLSSRIPLLGLSITMEDFYRYAPLVLLLFHIDVMYNVDKHLKKLDNAEDINDDNIYPYIVNFAFLNGWAIKIFMFIVLFAFGNFAFLYLFLEFSVIHVSSIYWWHLALLILDFVALFVIFGVRHYLSWLGVGWSVLIVALFLSSQQKYIIIENIDKIEHKIISLIHLQGISLSHFNGSDISFKNSEEINLIEAQIFNINITKSRFEFVDMSRSDIDDSKLTHNKFQNINLSNSNIKDSNLSYNIFNEVDFSNSNISNVDFSGSIFSSVDFCEANLSNIKLDKRSIFKYDIKCRDKIVKFQ